MTLRALLSALAVAATALHASPTPARTADVRVHYLLDERMLRAAGAATPVTIALFTDAACTAPSHETTLALGDVDLLLRVARTPLRGVPKAAKAVELRHTVRDVPPAAPLYARVTGADLAPIGDPCQVQTTAVAPARNSPVIVDGAGTVLGPYDVSASDGQPTWLRSAGDLSYAVAIEWGRIRGTEWQLFYEAADCSSPPLIYADYYSQLLFFPSVRVGDLLYYPAAPPIQRVTHASANEADTPADCGGGVFVPPRLCCRAYPSTQTFAADFLETATTDVGGYEPPFHVELR